MRTFKKLSILIAVFALSAIGAANVSAATFTASATGSLTGKATATQTFTVNGGQIKCASAAISGTIVSTASPEEHITVTHSACTAFGFANVHIPPTTILLTADMTYHILNTTTVNVTLGGCTITVKPQTVTKTAATNNGSKLKLTPNSHSIAYTSTGGLCGSSGANGTYTGTYEIERVGGGSISYDP